MPVPSDLQDAVREFDQYLSDRIAPLMMTEAMGTLLEYSPEVAASQIEAWVLAQDPAAQGASAADFIYHAVKKVFMMGEFELVPKDVLGRYVAGLIERVLPFCPEADRDRLKDGLMALGRSSAGVAMPLEVLHRAEAAAQPADAEGGALSRAVSGGLRRLSLFLERLAPQAAAPPERRQQLTSHFVVTAAKVAASQKELDERLEQLKQVGIAPDTDKLLRGLAQTLPGWGSLPSAPGTQHAPVSSELTAMRQIVGLADDPGEAAKRLRELVHIAIEQFNAGHLGRATMMFELAEQLALEKVSPVFVEALRRSGHQTIDAAQLKKALARPENRPELSTVLGFFDDLRPDGLLRQLDGEPQRERRRHLLDLLEVHGQASRERAYELLRASVQEPGAGVDPYFQMNLVYLLRLIPRPDHVAVEDEVSVVSAVLGRDSPAPLVKQVVTYLATSRHDKAERALIAYLRLFENMLLRPETATYDPADVETLLDRTCVALARYGTPRAWRALVDHGLKAEARLGSPALRLAEAGRVDLSQGKELVARMLEAIRAELPSKLLAFARRKDESRLVALIQALASTPLPEVKEVLEEVVARKPGEKSTEVAAKVLAGFDHSAGQTTPEVAGLAGDLDFFGLPMLMQTLGQSQGTGVLSLMRRDGQVVAIVKLEQGKLRSAQFGRLRGDEAVYQMLERPFQGSFAFVPRADLSSEHDLSAPRDAMELILEGVRRHDEFKAAAAVVPDEMALVATGDPHTPMDEEKADFIQTLWDKAAAGRFAVAQLEAAMGTDSFRVRRLLAHWFEEGALQGA